jgi:hypothetical protein
MCIPVPFQELSSVQYYSVDEQLTELTAALKLQFQRHCFIQIRQQETQPMLVPLVEPVTTFTYNRKNLDWYIGRQHEHQHALPAAEVDRLLEEQEVALLREATAASPSPGAIGGTEPAADSAQGTHTTGSPIRNRAPRPVEVPRAAPRKRGPKRDMENHSKVAALIRSFGENWTADDNLLEICDELDRQKIPPPKTWLTRPEGPARRWNRGRQNYPHLVIKAIKDRCKAASGDAA